MMRIEPRESPGRLLTLGVPVLSALVALALAAIPLALAGAPVGRAYLEMYRGVFGSVFAASEMLTRATPLIFTGLAAALAFRARLWNIGAEGQLYLGAMAAVAVGAGAVDAPGYVLMPLIVVAGASAGAAGMMLPAALKTRFGADEVVTTLLLNFIILIFVQLMLEGALKDPMSLGWPQSAPVLDQGMLPQLLPRMRIHSGLILALVLAGVAQFMLAPGQSLRAGRGRHLGRAGRAGWRQRGGRAQGLPDRGPVAGLWLYRHRGGHAGGAVARGRGGVRALHRQRLCRRG